MQTRTQIRFVAALFSMAALSSSGAANAHFNLVSPPPADSATDGGKGAPPCGPVMPSNAVTQAQGGHPITVTLDETVLHPGHYRIALSINSRTELPSDPVAVVQNGLSVSAPVENPPVFPVLADGVFTHTTGTTPIHFSTTVTLPNITCAKCTLQIIEFMAQHGPNPGGGYYYHHCADLQITADPSLPAGGGGSTGAGGGTGTGGGTTGVGGSTGAGGRSPASSSGGCAIEGRHPLANGSAAIVVLALVIVARRRRR